MMGLFNPPALMRLFSCDSTPVISRFAVGHKVDRVSRVTCCDASANRRATEIWGLFFRANSSASFSVSVLGGLPVGLFVSRALVVTAWAGLPGLGGAAGCGAAWFCALSAGSG